MCALRVRRLRLLLVRRAWMLAEAGEEECLVDSTVEDRDAQLEALGNHVSPLQPRLTCQLGGRQVICHFDPHPPSPTFTCQTVCLLRRMRSRRATAGWTAPRPRGHPCGAPYMRDIRK